MAFRSCRGTRPIRLCRRRRASADVRSLYGTRESGDLNASHGAVRPGSGPTRGADDTGDAMFSGRCVQLLARLPLPRPSDQFGHDVVDAPEAGTERQLSQVRVVQVEVAQVVLAEAGDQ